MTLLRSWSKVRALPVSPVHIRGFCHQKGERKMLEALCLFFMMLLPSLSQPVSSVIIDDLTVMSVHQKGEVSLVSPIFEENVMAISVAELEGDPQQGPEPVPHLTTSWVDNLGVTHTVTTPIPSSTPAGLKKSTDLHDALVKLMQAKNPPRPVPPP